MHGRPPHAPLLSRKTAEHNSSFNHVHPGRTEINLGPCFRCHVGLSPLLAPFEKLSACQPFSGPLLVFEWMLRCTALPTTCISDKNCGRKAGQCTITSSAGWYRKIPTKASGASARFCPWSNFAEFGEHFFPIVLMRSRPSNSRPCPLHKGNHEDFGPSRLEGRFWVPCACGAFAVMHTPRKGR